LTYSPALSQSFDLGDFIAPDILSVVDASVRATCADVLTQGILVGDLLQTFSAKPNAVFVSDMVFGGAVPSFDPDEFMPYKHPGIPVIPDFDVDEYRAETDALEIEAGVPDMEADAPVIETGESLAEVYAGTDEPEEERFVFDIPQPPRVSMGMIRVRFDTFGFDEASKEIFRTIMIIAIIAAANVFLLYYLLHI
jgi:hypothetical protein